MASLPRLAAGPLKDESADRDDDPDNRAHADHEEGR